MENKKAFSLAVVAPTYNNARTLRDVVGRLGRLGLPVIVVNDGSTDHTAEVLGDLREQLAIDVVTHVRNEGKAAALRSGFAVARAAGHTHVVTIDTDGQLEPEQIPQLAELAKTSPAALVLGTRDYLSADYPKRSRLGRRISNLLVRLESGLRVEDSQCGFRVYPLELMSVARCRAGRFAFETEVLTRAAWAGCEVRQLPISCKYDLPDGRVSHFRPWVDSLRAVGMHARLLARALVPWPHTRKRGHSYLLNRNVPFFGLRGLLEWLNPVRAWREMRQSRMGAQEMATGVALGVFIGNLPIYGAQTMLSLYTARRLHLHPISVVAGSQVSTPPVGLALIAAAIGVGHWLLHGSWLKLPQWQTTPEGWVKLIGNLMLEWSLGSVLVGVVTAMMAFVVSTVVLRYVAVAQD